MIIFLDAYNDDNDDYDDDEHNDDNFCQGGELQDAERKFADSYKVIIVNNDWILDFIFTKYLNFI